jgi:hypothetical protein
MALCARRRAVTWSEAPRRPRSDRREVSRLDDLALARLFAIASDDGERRDAVRSFRLDIAQQKQAWDAGIQARRAVCALRGRSGAGTALTVLIVLLLQTAQFPSSAIAIDGSLSSARIEAREEEISMRQSNRALVSVGVAGMAVSGLVGEIGLVRTARADSEIVAWGYNGEGQTNAPSGTFRAVAVGGHFYTGYSLGIRPDGSLLAWGSGIVGAVPTGDFVDVAGCNLSACALRTDGTLAWWGEAENGLEALPNGLWTELDGASVNFAVRRAAGTWFVWGDDSWGQNSAVPSVPLVELKVGPSRILARDASGITHVWGYLPPQLGQVPKGFLHSLWPAHTHSVALRSDGSAVCWGSNADGQCDAPAGPFRQIAAGGELRGFTVGLRTDGTLVSWGFNGNGERNVPATRVERIAVGQFHGLGAVADLCPGDVTDNGVIDAVDLAAILTAWGSSGGGEFDTDANRDGVVDALDLSIALGAWGTCLE